MASEKWMADRQNRIMRQLRMEDKARENQNKALLHTSDVMETKNFVFSVFRSGEEAGDSGTLLLARQKENREHRYVVKHAYTDCAANEFVYTKLAQAMDLKMPDAVLFRLSEGEKRSYWKTEYILGTQFLDLQIEAPTYAQIREKASNWQDFSRFGAMYMMCGECDSFETPLATDGYVYRIDTTASFILSNYSFDYAGINEKIGEIIPKEAVKTYIENYDYAAYWARKSFADELRRWTDRYGEECRAPYLDTFSRIQEVRADLIDGFLNTLCYFYPDFIGDYFKRYIDGLQTQSALFLKECR